MSIKIENNEIIVLNPASHKEVGRVNVASREDFDGVLDKSFEIPWEDYSNALLLVSEDDDLNHIHTHIYSIVDVKTWKK